MRLDENFYRDSLIGAVYGALAYPWIGVYACWTALASGLCWAYGGLKLKSVRRYGCPLCLYLPILVTFEPILVAVAYAFSVGVLSIGYGVRDFNQDKGSWLGEWWYRIFYNFMMPKQTSIDHAEEVRNQILWWTNVATRASWYLLLLVPYLITLGVWHGK